MTAEEAAIRQAVGVVQAAFPAGSGDWARKRFESWVGALRDLDPAAVAIAAERLVRDWADGYGRPPQPGHLRARALAATAEGRGSTSRRTTVTVDESALRDAIAALAYARTDDERGELERQVTAIRRRLTDRGARSDREGPGRFLQAEPHPFDPPGTIRFVVLQPDGTRRPHDGRVLGEGREPTPRAVPGVPHVTRGDAGVEQGSPYPRAPLAGSRAA